MGYTLLVHDELSWFVLQPENTWIKMESEMSKIDEEKKLILYAHGIDAEFHGPQKFIKPETFFSDEEVEAIKQAVAKSGKNKGHYKSSACPFGTPGYILQQARTMVFNAYRMPSECIILFNHEQQKLFWSLVAKFEILRDHAGVNQVMSAYAREVILK